MGLDKVNHYPVKYLDNNNLRWFGNTVVITGDKDKGSAYYENNDSPYDITDNNSFVAVPNSLDGNPVTSVLIATNPDGEETNHIMFGKGVILPNSVKKIEVSGVKYKNHDLLLAEGVTEFESRK